MEAPLERSSEQLRTCCSDMQHSVLRTVVVLLDEVGRHVPNVEFVNDDVG